MRSVSPTLATTLVSLCLCVNLWLLSYPRFLQSTPSVCLLLSLGRAVRSHRAWVPQPDGFLCLPGTFRAAEGRGEASSRGGTDVGMGKCSRSSTIWWSQFMLSSSVLRNILHLKSSVHQGQSLVQPWAPLRGAVNISRLLSWAPRGWAASPAPAQVPSEPSMGGTFPAPALVMREKAPKIKEKQQKAGPLQSDHSRVYFQFPVCLPYRKVNWLLLILQWKPQRKFC